MTNGRRIDPAPAGSKWVVTTLLAGALAVGLTACAPSIDTRGNLPDPDVVSELRPGIHDRDQVAQLLGSPSTVGTFDNSTWYYISKRTETVAFFEPEIVDQQVLALHFDNTGVLSDVQLYGYEDGRVIDPVDRVTPTSGQEMTILKQLFGNIGRFNRTDEE
jgi:outer membrane protein assembly factor BamE (lipoprotein component of BamABCDE complex)